MIQCTVEKIDASNFMNAIKLASRDIRNYVTYVDTIINQARDSGMGDKQMILQIKSSYNDLTDLEKCIADYALELL